MGEDPVLAAITNPTVAENQLDAGIDASATDPQGDTDNGGGLDYSLTGTDSAALSIDALGVVTFGSAPDFETKNSYSINVVVTDPQGHTDSQAVTITISDVAETLTFTLDMATLQTRQIYVNDVLDTGARTSGYQLDTWTSTDLMPGDVIKIRNTNGKAVLKAFYDGTVFESGNPAWTTSATQIGIYAAVATEGDVSADLPLNWDDSHGDQIMSGGNPTWFKITIPST